MKPHITFPYIRLALKPRLLLALLLLIALTTGLLFFPKSAAQLTIFNNFQQINSQCSTTLGLHQPYTKGSITGLSSPFTLFNWNIYKQQGNQWQEKLQEWMADADLLTLQEVKYSPAIKLFSERNKLSYIQNYAFNYQGFVYGVATLSRQVALSVCGTRDNEPWIRVYKTGLASRYALNNHHDSLLLINLHAVNFTFTTEPLRKQLQPYLAQIATHPGPVIFSGDFNTWSDARLATINTVLHNHGFHEVLFNQDQRITRFGHPLDHIYFRGLTVIKAESMATQASDHTPQLVTFALLP
ncbi:endonuclease/exonuclease/phosphatase family protein [Psychromonas antarctica]|uniref:endonuclease/exonuclease/phosphatase family protein n=1 Tax=Psychromonas antarctica TaxID=67573 RepID=UPI001EE7F063|nr:endonuclease/exonuclease/phosphatase family protein [Psychromonas antarctica]MCG6202477.1 endonuclease/exonuclease/phosphatase family protein [Psychromonas antarctica]